MGQLLSQQYEPWDGEGVVRAWCVGEGDVLVMRKC